MAGSDPNNLIQKLQSQVENATDRVVSTFDNHFSKLVPHGIMDEAVPPNEELMEYISTIAQADDPVTASHEWIDARKSQYGEPVARTMYYKYVERNEKRIQKLLEEQEGESDVRPLP